MGTSLSKQSPPPRPRKQARAWHLPRLTAQRPQDGGHPLVRPGDGRHGPGQSPQRRLEGALGREGAAADQQLHLRALVPALLQRDGRGAAAEALGAVWEDEGRAFVGAD